MDDQAKKTKVLKDHFGFNSFRQGQDEIIEAILKGIDVCGVLATGKGKSLCYQFPAIYLERTSVVISPLISLMKDQRMALEAKGISATVLSGGTANYLNIMRRVVEGDFSVVYTTPEHLYGNSGFLKTMIDNQTLALVAIDEAHCISQWGHDFRPSYRHLTDIKAAVKSQVPILALTATATPNIIKDMCEQLKFDKTALTVSTGVRRENLALHVKLKGNTGRNPSNLSILRDLKSVLPTPDQIHHHSTIIYTQKRQDAQDLCVILQEAGYPAQYYHAGMSDKARSKVHEDFIYDRCQLVVATIAFGMGIDKPSIRLIVIWGLPQNIETYYQEIGRAGRDGLPSDCYLFYAPNDIGLQRFLISKMEETQVKEHNYHLLTMMRRFTENRNVCRQILLEQYYTREQISLDIAPTGYEPCKICDNCQANSSRSSLPNSAQPHIGQIDVGPQARQLYNLVRDLHPRQFGLKNLLLCMIGSKSNEINKYLTKIKQYGSGKSQTSAWWRALGNYMIDREHLAYLKKGGLYQTARSSSTNNNNNKVFQVVTLGPQALPTDGHLWITPNSNFHTNILTGQSSKTTQSNHISKSMSSIINIPTSHDSTSGQFDSGDLLTRLRDFRQTISRKMGLPPYTVLSDPVINSLLTLPRPTTITKLSLVDGIHTRVLMEWGEQLLSTLNLGFEESSDSEVIEVDLTPTKPTSSDPILDKLAKTQLTTLEHLQKGLTVQEVIKARKFTNNTIENHVMKIFELTGTSYLNPNDYISSPQSLQAVLTYLKTHTTNSGLRPIKDALKSTKTSYLDIKIGMALHRRAHLSQSQSPQSSNDG